jgi:hypothetical protein
LLITFNFSFYNHYLYNGSVGTYILCFIYYVFFIPLGPPSKGEILHRFSCPPLAGDKGGGSFVFFIPLSALPAAGKLQRGKASALGFLSPAGRG